MPRSKEIEERNKLIVDMHYEGYGSTAIAKKLGLPFSTVSSVWYTHNKARREEIEKTYPKVTGWMAEPS